MEYHHSRAVPFAAAILMLTAMSACGRAQGEGTDAARSEGTRAEGAIPICKLLTAQEVSAVLPKNDGGMEAASGESLAKNTKNYQCSYAAVRGNDADLLTVIVLVASDSAAFRFIKPNPSSKQDSYPIFRELAMGDGAVLYGKPGDIQVETWKGMTVVALELIAPGAERHADDLTRLASIVASKVK
jgi:hypothetical protein